MLLVYTGNQRIFNGEWTPESSCPDKNHVSGDQNGVVSLCISSIPVAVSGAFKAGLDDP